MQQRFVSAVAVLFCCAVVAIVAIFGYTRYLAAEAANAAFRAELKNAGPNTQASLDIRMPAQLPAGASSAGGSATATPKPSP